MHHDHTKLYNCATLNARNMDLHITSISGLTGVVYNKTIILISHCKHIQIAYATKFNDKEMLIFIQQNTKSFNFFHIFICLPHEVFDILSHIYAENKNNISLQLWETDMKLRRNYCLPNIPR